MIYIFQFIVCVSLLCLTCVHAIVDMDPLRRIKRSDKKRGEKSTTHGRFNNFLSRAAFNIREIHKHI